MNNEELIRVFSSYLPYNLKIGFQGEDLEHSLVGLELSNEGVQLISPFGDFGRAKIEDCKPILYDLSYLTKEIELTNEEGHIYPKKISIIDYLNIAKSDQYSYHPKLNCLRLNSYGKGYTQWNFDVNGQFELSYRIFRLLIINHFNVFGLSKDEFINKATLNYGT